MPFSRTNQSPLVIQVVVLSDGSFGAVTRPWGRDREITKAQHDALLMLDRMCNTPEDIDDENDPVADALSKYGAVVHCPIGSMRLVRFLEGTTEPQSLGDDLRWG